MTDVTPVPSEPVEPSKAFLGQKTYDFLKFVAMILLPAAGTLYFTLAQIWEWSNGEKVVGTIMAVDLFLGALLGIAARSYNNSDARFGGVIEVAEVPEGPKVYSMVLNSDPADLDQQSEVTFKIQPLGS
jgi:hypothetical protein